MALPSSPLTLKATRFRKYLNHITYLLGNYNLTSKLINSNSFLIKPEGWKSVVVVYYIVGHRTVVTQCYSIHIYLGSCHTVNPKLYAPMLFIKTTCPEQPFQNK